MKKRGKTNLWFIPEQKKIQFILDTVANRRDGSWACEDRQ